jgi:hypothetical protein
MENNKQEKKQIIERLDRLKSKILQGEEEMTKLFYSSFENTFLVSLMADQIVDEPSRFTDFLTRWGELTYDCSLNICEENGDPLSNEEKASIRKKINSFLKEFAIAGGVKKDKPKDGPKDDGYIDSKGNFQKL